MRVKVEVAPGQVVSIGVRSNQVKGNISPALLDIVRKWIILNYAAIKDLWEFKISYTEEFISRLQTIAGRENDSSLDWSSFLASLPKSHAKSKTKKKKKSKK